MIEDDVIDNCLRALQEAATVIEGMRGTVTEQLHPEALLVITIATVLDGALCVHYKRNPTS